MSSGEDLDDSELKIDEGSKIEEPEEAPPAGMMFIFRVRVCTTRTISVTAFLGHFWVHLSS